MVARPDLRQKTALSLLSCSLFQKATQVQNTPDTIILAKLLLVEWLSVNDLTTLILMFLLASFENH